MRMHAMKKTEDLPNERESGSAELVRFNGNPIIHPIPEHAWEASATFNPGAVQTDGKIHLLYRAMSPDNVSVFGYACTRDGLHIDERLPEPVYVPRMPFESKQGSGGSGCEDPRLTLIGETLYVCYTAYDGLHPPRIALTSISLKNFLAKKWIWMEPMLVSPPEYDDKDAALFPKKIDGMYVMLHRIGLSVWIDFLPDLTFEGNQWLNGTILMNPRGGVHDSQKIGICGPPIETSDGWLLLYHGVSKHEDRHYHVRAALLDLNDPRKVTARTAHPIFEPEMPYEREGLVNNVVFPCGTAILNDILYVYYGGADKVAGVASVTLRHLLNQLREERVSPGV